MRAARRRCAVLTHLLGPQALILGPVACYSTTCVSIVFREMTDAEIAPPLKVAGFGRQNLLGNRNEKGQTERSAQNINPWVCVGPYRPSEALHAP